MSNVIRFPAEAASHRTASDRGRTFAELPDPSHAVQFYEEEEFLFDTVAQFLAAGLLARDQLVVIATDPHRVAFARRLEAFGVEQAIDAGQLTFVDAREMLSKFMVGTMPDADLFRDTLARLIAKVKGDGPRRPRLRAYGEMVDLLWRDGNARAAIRLEELWNEAGKEHSFSLLCAYVMGNFYQEGDAARFLEVCRNHSHVIPTESFSQLDDSHARLREISLLQQRARALESEIQHRKELESALRDALKERSRAEEELRASVRLEREARAQAEESDAFKEVFLGILGHDLRNPLNTILTTVRLMTLRRELPPETHKRLERVVVSGMRMQRMINQLLDVARARRVSGIPVTRSDAQDLVPLVSKIIEETRVVHPARAIEIHAAGPCMASVDADRFEQVVSNLLGNAVAHGDPNHSIRVEVTARDGVAGLSVHNYGMPIDPAFMPMLFDPFKRGERPQGGSDGLGLGLYISERIVSAHGGKIGVESSEEAGTRFDATFPGAHERGGDTA